MVAAGQSIHGSAENGGFSLAEGDGALFNVSTHKSLLSGVIGMSVVHWLLLGIALMVLEVMTPGLVSIFFGLAALVVGIVVWLWPTCPVTVQYLSFALLSVVFLFLLRRLFRRAFTGRRTGVADGLGDEYVGQHAMVVALIRPDEAGKVEFHGSHWRAEADEVIEPGVSVLIAARDNLTLKVRRPPQVA
jgi:membrane protein implicated in regulation of membrane protease activity